MKIKEVEQKTGITAKNIRFYEQQGLLAPSRNPENSYRDYDVDDLHLLKTIKVLRKLDMPLENIREVIDGRQQLGEAMERHCAFLEQSMRELEAAQRLCKELVDQRPQLATLDADDCLQRIETLEQQGARFTDIFNDFKLVAAAVDKMRFHFFPDVVVNTPQELTAALRKYATEQKLDMVITKESMYPEFTIDGVEYVAQRYGGFAISAEAKEPDSLLPRHIPHRRCWWLEWAWRMAFPALLILGLILLMVWNR